MNIEKLENINDPEELKNIIIKLNNRINKIIKISDKQQKELIKLNELIHQKEQKLREIYNYDQYQQLVATRKIASTIVNELENSEEFECRVVYIPQDTLSGDYYSIYYRDNRIFYFIIDGQGHGISPALTVFAVAAMFRERIHLLTLDKILPSVFEFTKQTLLKDEQLSYTFIEIDFSTNKIYYAIGGMYPTYFLGEDLVKIRANNFPFTKRTKKIEVSSIDFKEFYKIFSYSDGLIEYQLLKKFNPKDLIFDISKLNEVYELS